MLVVDGIAQARRAIGHPLAEQAQRPGAHRRRCWCAKSLAPAGVAGRPVGVVASDDHVAPAAAVRLAAEACVAGVDENSSIVALPGRFHAGLEQVCILAKCGASVRVSRSVARSFLAVWPGRRPCCRSRWKAQSRPGRRRSSCRSWIRPGEVLQAMAMKFATSRLSTPMPLDAAAVWLGLVDRGSRSRSGRRRGLGALRGEDDPKVKPAPSPLSISS